MHGWELFEITRCRKEEKTEEERKEAFIRELMSLLFACEIRYL